MEHSWGWKFTKFLLWPLTIGQLSLLNLPFLISHSAVFIKISYEFLMKLVGYPTISEERIITPFYRVQGDFQELSQDERNQVLDYIHFLKSKRKKLWDGQSPNLKCFISVKGNGFITIKLLVGMLKINIEEKLTF